MLIAPKKVLRFMVWPAHFGGSMTTNIWLFWLYVSLIIPYFSFIFLGSQFIILRDVNGFGILFWLRSHYDKGLKMLLSNNSLEYTISMYLDISYLNSQWLYWYLINLKHPPSLLFFWWKWVAKFKKHMETSLLMLKCYNILAMLDSSEWKDASLFATAQI